MPIRFRCAYCNQLMGIARRKAGTVVRCPTCAGQVVVPANDQEDVDKEPEGAPEPPLFERSDFDEVFTAPGAPGAAQPPPTYDPGPSGGGAPVEAPQGAWGTHAEPNYDVERVDLAQMSRSASVEPLAPAPGIVLSPGKAT